MAVRGLCRRPEWTLSFATRSPRRRSPGPQISRKGSLQGRSMPEKLHDFARRAAARWPSRRAVDAPDRSVTYAELDLLANRYATLLRSHEVARGSRVGIYLDKSADAVVAMQAVLRLGAAYVPLDPLGP